MNIFKSWREVRKRLAAERLEGRHLAFISSVMDPQRAYRCANETDQFFIYKDGEVSPVSFEEFNQIFDDGKRTAQEINVYKSPGGVITFSSAITHKTEDGERVPLSGVKEKLFGFMQSFLQRYFPHKKVDEAMRSLQRPIGFSLGNFFSGRYIDKQNRLFDEKSASIDIKGVTSDELKKIAHALCEQFDQNSVIVEDKNTGNAYEYVRKV